MCARGKGLEAINYTVLGGIIAVIIGTLLTHPFFLFLEQNQTQLTKITPLVLSIALIIFIKEGKTFKQKIGIIFVIIAAGCQGILFQNQLFPLITDTLNGWINTFNKRNKNSARKRRNSN